MATDRNRRITPDLFGLKRRFQFDGQAADQTVDSPKMVKPKEKPRAFSLSGLRVKPSTHSCKRGRLKRRFRSAAIQPPIQPPNSNGGFIRRPGRRSRPPITNRGENQGDAKCISIGGLRAKPSTF
ncbi:hypothetical protein Q3G72_020172 [Acer saccharum]|nr:hypothetical protein Q3G72_020172 [Acer saccharum]